MFRNRIKILRSRFKSKNLDGMLITDITNLRYLINFTGSNGLLFILPKDSIFFTDFRYKEQARLEVRNARVQIRTRNLFDPLPTEYLLKNRIRRLGFEATAVSVSNYLLIKKQIKGIRLFPADKLISEMRQVKDEEEITRIKKAAQIGDKVFEKILNYLKPGIREKNLALEIDYWIKSEAELAFPTIVASGFRAALPHAQPTEKRIKTGETIIFDFGAKYDGYCADMSRTIILGKAQERIKEIYEIVHNAQAIARDAIKAGVSGKDIDSKVRDYINQKGFGEFFGHGLGHGVGLLVHEAPILSQLSKDTLRENNVITCEPGIYLPKCCGVRIEDSVVVKNEGCKVLTKSPRELIEL